MNQKTEVSKQADTITEFYDGKSLFITGAAGYFGSVLLEILLRCLPGISNIFILLRPKKGVSPEERKNVIFQKRIFKVMMEERQDLADKVHVIPGDVSHPNLGMVDEDIARVAQKVTIIFHVAAIISFFKPLRYTSIQNSLGTKNVVEFARKLKKLEVLVYTSTAYSNCNRDLHIEETIYRLPFSAERFLNALTVGVEGEFEKLVSLCKPDWPNDYTFSKSFAENILSDMASDLPIAILRPSIIASIAKGTHAGYIEDGTGLVDFSLAVGKGFARLVNGDPDSRFDLIPADMVGNFHIAAAWAVATNRLPTPFIANCTGGPWMVTFGEYCSSLNRMVERNLLPKSFQKHHFVVIKNKIYYRLLTIYEHYIPAYFLDVALYLKGSKLRLVPMYFFLEKVMKNLVFFITRTFSFEMNNFYALERLIESEEKETFYMDLENVSVEDMVSKVKSNTDFYDWKTDKKSKEARRKTVERRTMMINIIKNGAVVLLLFLLYIILSIFL